MQLDAGRAPLRDERVRRAAQLGPMRRLARRRQGENSGERLVERREPTARGRDDGKHRHAAERLLQPTEVDLAPFALRRIDHRQRDDHGPAEVDELLEQIEPLVKTRRVDDGQDGFRARRTRNAAEQYVDGDLLVGGRRAQGIRARQVDEIERHAAERAAADAPLDRDSGIVGRVLA